MNIENVSRRTLCHFNLRDTQFDTDNTITRKISAMIIDAQEETIVQACVDAAKREGVSDLYLLDKKFVLDALREKIQGRICPHCGGRMYGDPHASP